MGLVIIVFGAMLTAGIVGFLHHQRLGDFAFKLATEHRDLAATWDLTALNSCERKVLSRVQWKLFWRAYRGTGDSDGTVACDKFRRKMVTLLTVQVLAFLVFFVVGLYAVLN